MYVCVDVCVYVRPLKPHVGLYIWSLAVVRVLLV